MIVAKGQGYAIHNNQGADLTLDIFGDIADYWGNNVESVARALLGKSGPMRVRLSSPGGDLIHGIAIMNLLRDYPGDVTVEVVGVAASAASFVAMGGDRVVMNPGSFLMIHNPVTVVYGEASQMQSTAEALTKMETEMANVYVQAMRKRKKYEDKEAGELSDMVRAWMNAETWFTPAEALEHGFADEISQEPGSVSDEAIIAGAASFSQYQNTPGRVLNLIMKQDEKTLLDQIKALFTVKNDGGNAQEVDLEAAKKALESAGYGVTEPGAEPEKIAEDVVAETPAPTQEPTPAPAVAPAPSEADIESRISAAVAKAMSEKAAAQNPAAPAPTTQSQTSKADQVRAKVAKGFDSFAQLFKK